MFRSDLEHSHIKVSTFIFEKLYHCSSFRFSLFHFIHQFASDKSGILGASTFVPLCFDKQNISHSLSYLSYLLLMVFFYLSGIAQGTEAWILVMMVLWWHMLQIYLTHPVHGTIMCLGRPRRNFTHCQMQSVKKTSWDSDQSLEKIFQETTLPTGRPR